MTRLEWRDGPHGRRDGFAGKVRMFTSNWDVTRDDPEKPVVLRSTLPGYDRKAWNLATRSEADDLAERLIDQWLRETGLTT